MKKFARAAVVILVAVFPLNAQSAQVAPEVQQLLEEQGLLVQVPAVVGNPGLLPPDPARRWTVTQGARPLSEATFYQVAGLPEKARKASTYRTTAWALIGWGAAQVALGTGLVVAAVESKGSMSSSSLYGGVALTLWSTIPLWAGVDRVLNRWSTVDEAKAAADEFNSRLAESLLSGGEK